MGQAVCLELHTHNLTKPPTALGGGHSHALHVTEQESEAQASDRPVQSHTDNEQEQGLERSSEQARSPLSPLLPQLV